MSGNFRDCIACKTVSQWPLLMSATKLSMLSTVLRETVVSSCRVANARYKLFSFKYCMMRRITLRENKESHQLRELQPPISPFTTHFPFNYCKQSQNQSSKLPAKDTKTGVQRGEIACPMFPTQKESWIYWTSVWDTLNLQ